MSGTYWRKAAVSAAALLAACGAAMGQSYQTDFDASYTGSATGTITTGQQGWYLPAAGGLDHNIFTYAGNSLGVAANATGGTQFDAGQGGANVARAQHDVDFSSGGTWQAEFDVNALYVGTPPSIDNLGSFSLQDSLVARYFQQLMNWGSNTAIIVPTGTTLTNYTATPDHFHMPWGYFTDALPNAITFECPSTAWMDLPTNNWYRVKVRWTFDVPNPRLLSVSIRNLTLGTAEVTDDVSGRGWFLAGGSNSTLPIATAVRLFAGGTGSVTAWDNLNVFKVSTCYPDCNGDHALNVNDFICFQGAFAGNNLPLADCNHDTVLNVNDFICFQSAFAAGCSQL